ncbi:hypothetical protein FPV67DRAFT_1505488 [Lyophyllum atratum]|nr:hypothetical protein FPV67DRAFT_1505488 [Lyophyllum atratum]
MHHFALAVYKSGGSCQGLSSSTNQYSSKPSSSMIASKVYALFALIISTHASRAASRTNSAVNFVPVSPQGNVAAIQLPGPPVQTRLYWQDNTGAIVQYALTNGAFTTGKSISSAVVVVPATDVLRYTPIVATVIGDASQGVCPCLPYCSLTANISMFELHVFFLAPNRTLSEWRFTVPAGGRSGDACPGCIVHSGFAVAEGSDVLYALEEPISKGLRVGFVSPGAPGTLTEAVSADDGATWQLATMPA